MLRRKLTRALGPPADDNQAAGRLLLRASVGSAVLFAHRKSLLATALLCAVASSAAAQERPPPKTLRHLEDTAYLRGYEGAPELLDPIKDVVLDDDGDHSLSFGATLRFRQDVLDQPFFGLAGASYDDFTSLRALVHADGRFTRTVRAFAEVGSMWAFGRTLPERPVDENHLAVQQLFLDLRPLPEDLPADLTVRAGRQTFSLGSARLIGIREGPNVRLSFDGVRAMVTSEVVDAQLLAVGVPALEPGAFDDRPTLDEGLFGAYATLNLLAPAFATDLYYLGYRNTDASWGLEGGHELRHSIGARLFGEGLGFDYNTEAVLQVGTFEGAAGDDLAIRAWTVATDQGYTLAGEDADLRLGVRANIASGDGDPTDDTLGTFFALFPKQPYFSQLTLLAPSNLMDVHPSIRTTWLDTVSTQVGVDFFWRHRTGDGLYRPPGIALLDGFSGRFTGTQLNAEVAVQATRTLAITLYASRFHVSDAFRLAGGVDASFLGFWTTALL